LTKRFTAGDQFLCDAKGKGESRMPKFNAEEQEELRRILDGEDSLDNSFEGIRFSDLDDFDEPSNREGKQINASVGKSGEWSKQTASGN
jgi:hypothetical protein